MNKYICVQELISRLFRDLSLGHLCSNSLIASATAPQHPGVVRLHVNAFYFSTTAGRVTSPTWGPPPPCKQALTVSNPTKTTNCLDFNILLRKGARKLWEQNWFQRVMTFWNPLVSMPNLPVYYLRHRRSVVNLWRVRRFCIIVINDGMCEGFLVFFQLYLLGEYPEEQFKATKHN